MRNAYRAALDSSASFGHAFRIYRCPHRKGVYHVTSKVS